MKHTGHTKNTENIGLIEDLRTEFKSDVKKLSEETIVEAVVALANTEGGTLYIGVEDDGTITGVHKNHQSTAGLSAMILIVRCLMFLLVQILCTVLQNLLLVLRFQRVMS